MDVKEFLSQHKIIDDCINAKLDEIKELRSLATRLSPSLSGESHSVGTVSDRVGRTAAKIADLEKEVNDEIDKLIGVKAEITAMINSLEDILLRNLLERRYLLGFSWEKIAEDMGYTPRHITRLHNKAIARLELLYSDVA